MSIESPQCKTSAQFLLRASDRHDRLMNKLHQVDSNLSRLMLFNMSSVSDGFDKLISDLALLKNFS